MAFRAPALLAALISVTLLLGAPAVASAALPVEHVSTAVTEPTGNGIVGPGDTVQITETIVASGPATGMQATLTSDDVTKATVVQGTSTYGDLAFGQQGTNAAPFEVNIDPLLACGETVSLTLSIAGDTGTTDIPIRVSTGAAGEPFAVTSTHVPRAIPSTGTVESNTVVEATGRAKRVSVRIGDLDHTYVGDLRITVTAPDGRSAVIFDQAGGSGDDITDATFVTDGGADVGTLSPPYAGQEVNAPGLAVFEGAATQGTWRLEIDDVSPGEFGELKDWGLEIETATCAPTPIASFTATPNPVDPGATVTLDGTGSTDPDDPIDAYDWDLDGDGQYDDFSGPVATTSYPAPQAVDVGLQVTAGGETDTARTTLAVTGAPAAALAATPTASPQTAETITLDASGSTDDGTIAGYEWDIDGDGLFERSTGATATTTASWTAPGARIVRVRVTDDLGAKGTASLEVNVQNRLPTATIGSSPTPALAGQTTTLTAVGATDPDGSVTGYDWDFDGDGTWDELNVQTTSIAHVYATPGTKTVRLRVRDDAGGVSPDIDGSVLVTTAPVAALQATPNPVALNQTVTFDATASDDPDGPAITKFEWDLDGNATYERDTGTTGTTTTSYATAGTRTVRVRVTDADGATAVATVDLVASNALPVAGLVATPASPVAGEAVALDASGSSDADGTIASYAWDLDGDNSYETSTGTTPTTSTSFANAGTVRVRVRVIDNDGGSAVASQLLTVTAPDGGGATGGGDGGGTGDGSGDAGGDGSATASGGGTTAGTDTGAGGGSAGATAGGTEPGAGDTAGTASRPFGASLGGAPIQRLKAVLRRGLSVSCEAAGAASCVLSAELSAADARRLRLARKARRPVRIGRATRAVAAGGSSRLTLRLSARARRALRRAKRVRIVLRGYATASGASQRVSLTRVVLVRR